MSKDLTDAQLADIAADFRDRIESMSCCFGCTASMKAQQERHEKANRSFYFWLTVHLAVIIPVILYAVNKF